MSLQYVIDGYNIINHPQFSRTQKSPEDPVGSLLWLIRSKRLTGSAKNKVIVVFDGYPKSVDADYGASGPLVLFSRKISADEKIKRLVEESGQRKSILVVSDDKEIKFSVRSLGARIVAVDEFLSPGGRSKAARSKEAVSPEISYASMSRINKELRKIWLGE